MHINVRTIDAKTKKIITVSKTTKVLTLKKMLEQHFNIQSEKQRLFFRGKQLEDEYTLFDYNINVNDMVQIMEKVSIEPPNNDDIAEAGTSKSTQSEDDSNDVDKASFGDKVESTQYFKVGEFVDLRDSTYGAWFEGKIINIYKDAKYDQNKEKFKEDEVSGFPHDGYFYELSTFEEDSSTIRRLLDLRPRTRDVIPYKDLKVGDKVLVNYNVEEPAKRGFWFEATISQLENKKKDDLIVNLKIGKLATMNDCKIIFKDEVMKIEDTKPLTERNVNLDSEPTSRISEVPYYCNKCKNNDKLNCKECGCHICGLKTEESKQIMCDECDMAYHIWCLSPPLEQIPDTEEWYCHECKTDENEIVAAGSKLKESKKKAKMASKQNNTTRDWGKGMACVARTKACTMVAHDHFGPVPGIEVGTLWKFRIQVSEAGVHRPHVAGIHGRETVGAFSIVLSGGYEDDIDNGDEVYYTGSGGRDLSGNKRTNIQGFDQELSRFNKAIAMNCNAPLNEKGGESKDWRAGKPVRVVRNYKLSKHSKYAPEEGNRYDGIYKVVKYYPEKGKSGFTVWRFLFRRDDPTPAPWTAAGKKRIAALGLVMQYPEGYIESSQMQKDSDKTPKKRKSKGNSKKRVLEESPNSQTKADKKKLKAPKYELEKEVSIAIQKDTQNEKLWDECKKELDFGKAKYLAKVEEVFSCICCTELLYQPITTTECNHNFCFDCIKRAIKAEVITCPTCRTPLDEDISKQLNSSLQEALSLLFPGYTAARKTSN